MNKHAAIYLLYPQVATIREDVAFDVDGSPINYDEALVQAEMQRHAYKDQRSAEYPSFAEQFDTLYHGGYDAWKATIDAVKNKYPKPE